MMQDKDTNQINRIVHGQANNIDFSFITSISITFIAIHKAPLYCSFSIFHKLNVKSGILYRIHNRRVTAIFTAFPHCLLPSSASYAIYIFINK